MTESVLETTAPESVLEESHYRPMSATEICASLGLSSAIAGALISVSDTGTVAPVTIAPANQVLIAGATAPAWSGTALTYVPGTSPVLKVGDGATPAAAAKCELWLNGAAGSERNLAIMTGGVSRWYLRGNNTAETGADAGSNLQLIARKDDGSAVDSSVLTITRAAGGAIALGPAGGRPVVIGTSAALGSERVLISGGGALPAVAATQIAFSAGGAAFGAGINVAGSITHSGVNLSSGSTAGRLAYFGGSNGDGAGIELHGSTYASSANTGFLRVGATYVANWNATSVNIPLTNDGALTVSGRITAKVGAAGASMTTVAEIAAYIRSIIT